MTIIRESINIFVAQKKNTEEEMITIYISITACLAYLCYFVQYFVMIMYLEINAMRN